MPVDWLRLIEARAWEAETHALVLGQLWCEGIADRNVSYVLGLVCARSRRDRTALPLEVIDGRHGVLAAFNSSIGYLIPSRANHRARVALVQRRPGIGTEVPLRRRLPELL